MSTSGMSWITLLLCLLGGGGNDLLDYVPTEVYWTAQAVDPAELSVDMLVGELDGAADDGPDPAAPAAGEVRRLMAIRTLGEMRQRAKAALPALEELLESQERFVSDYARTATAAINGDAVARQRPVLAIRTDVGLLPADCGVVAQFAPRNGRPIGLAEALAAVPAPKAQGEEGVDPRDVVNASAGAALDVAEQLGNVRLDALTLGVSKDLGDQTGFGVLVLRGQFDAERLRTLLRNSRVPTRRAEGMEVFEPSGEAALLVVSDELAVFVAAPRPEAMPLAEVIAAVKEPTPRWKLSAPMKELVETVDTTETLWAVGLRAPAYEGVPLLGDFDSVTLEGVQSRGALSVTATGRSKDAKAAKAAAAAAEESVNVVARELRAEADGSAVAGVLAGFLDSLQWEVAGGRATVTGRLKAPPAALLAAPVDGGAVAEPTTD